MRIRTKAASKPGRPPESESFNMSDSMRQQVDQHVARVREKTTPKSVVEEALRIGLEQMAKRG
jgi:hypothetical protein